MQGITEVLQKEFQRAFPKAEKRDSRLWTGLGTGPENRVSGLGDKAQGRRDKGQKERLWLLLKDLRLVLSSKKERLTEKSEEALGVDEHVHYLDYGDGFTSALISKRIKFYKF